MMQQGVTTPIEREVQFPAGPARLEGNLSIPANPAGIVLFAHGSGSSRHSPRNVFVARSLQKAGVGTLLFDLLTREEEAVDIHTREYRFDIDLLATRLAHATEWLQSGREFEGLRIGYFGASTGSAAALIAAAELGGRIGAVVSRGGRPDLADEALTRVSAPTLLIVGSRDDAVIELNEQAFRRLTCRKDMALVAGASHLFEEPGTLQEVARLASAWFVDHLGH